MEFEVVCKCGSNLTIKEEDVFKEIKCPFCGKSYLLNELNSELYELYYNKRRNEFEISNQTVKKYNGTGGKVYIPSDVVSIFDRAFLRNGQIESVICSDSLRHIGSNAFGNCFALKEITFNKGLESIGEDAFLGCGSLGKIEIPNSVKTIFDEAFMDCKGLNEIKFSETSKTVIGKSAFEGAKRLKEIELYDGMTVEGRAFLDCENLEKVVINGTVNLKDNAFAGCKNLTVYITEKKGLFTPKWFNPKAFNASAKIVWNYKG